MGRLLRKLLIFSRIEEVRLHRWGIHQGNPFRTETAALGTSCAELAKRCLGQESCPTAYYWRTHRFGQFLGDVPWRPAESAHHLPFSYSTISRMILHVDNARQPSFEHQASTHDAWHGDSFNESTHSLRPTELILCPRKNSRPRLAYS